jgi:hypothetical protein
MVFGDESVGKTPKPPCIDQEGPQEKKKRKEKKEAGRTWKRLGEIQIWDK